MEKRNFLNILWKIVSPMLIYIFVQIIVVMAIQTGYMVYWYMQGVSSDEITYLLTNALEDKTLILTMVSALITIPILVLLMKKDINRKKQANTLKKYRLSNNLLYLLIIPFAIFNMEWANMLVSVLQIFMPRFMLDSYSGVEAAIFGSSVALQIVAAGIVGPVVEELLFRGLIYKRLREFTGINISAVLSAVIFGIFHGNWVQAPYAIIIGLAAVFVYEKYKSIIAPVLFHMSVNMASIGMSYIAFKMQQSQGESVQQFSDWYFIKTISAPMLIFFVLAFVMGIFINSKVKPKEVGNEVIDSSNSML